MKTMKPWQVLSVLGVVLIGFVGVAALAGPAKIPDSVTGDGMVVKYEKINANTSGDNTLLAAVTGKRIRVLAVNIICTTAGDVRFESGASGTALTGQYPVAANGGFVLPYSPVGWFQTASATLLNLELSGTLDCNGSFVYVEASTTGD